MTNEQWLLYVYGIYPEGGMTTLLIITTLILSGLSLIGFFEQITELDGLRKYAKASGVAAMIVLTLGYFIPDKKVFAAMMITPTVVESYKSGTIAKAKNALDATLDNIAKEANEKHRLLIRTEAK